MTWACTAHRGACFLTPSPNGDNTVHQSAQGYCQNGNGELSAEFIVVARTQQTPSQCFIIMMSLLSYLEIQLPRRAEERSHLYVLGKIISKSSE